MIDTNTLKNYLDRINNKQNPELETVINREGKLNNIEYFIEVKKEYYPKPKGMLIIKLGNY